MPIWEDVDARQHAHKERNKVVLLLLRHTGPRLHDIPGMTAESIEKHPIP